MNMAGLMDRLTYIYLLILHCSSLVCIYGSDQNLSSSCDPGVLVPRGTTWKAAPRQRVTVSCPAQHCGQTLNVSWCKLLDTHECEQINATDNGGIRQNVQYVNDKMIAYLTFERISIYDNGLYRCYLKGYSSVDVSHIINVSVSDLYQGIEHSDNRANQLPSAAGDEDASWLAYFLICLSIALLVAILTLLTLLSLQGWTCLLTHNVKKTQEMSTHMIPDLPSPSTFVLRTHFSTLSDDHSLNISERPPSHLSFISGKQPAVANVAEESQASEHAYAVTNHWQTRIPTREKMMMN